MCIPGWTPDDVLIYWILKINDAYLNDLKRQAKYKLRLLRPVKERLMDKFEILKAKITHLTLIQQAIWKNTSHVYTEFNLKMTGLERAQARKIKINQESLTEIDKLQTRVFGMRARRQAMENKINRKRENLATIVQNLSVIESVETKIKKEWKHYHELVHQQFENNYMILFI